MNRLCLNPAKTQIIWLESKRQVKKVNILDVPIMATSLRAVDSDRDLGVVVDSHLTMTTHVTAVYQHAWTTASHYTARDQRQPVPTPTSRSKCRGTLHHQHEKVRAHHARPTAATLASSPPTCSIQDRRAGVQGTPRPLTCVYLAEDCQLVSVTGLRQLRSSDIDTCLVQRTNTLFGDRSFAVAGPRVWNSLPTQLREADITLGQFRRALKTHLFGH